MAIGFPHIGQGFLSIAIPLRTLARFWVAYYWPFVNSQKLIPQGQQASGKEDISFRPALNHLREEWEKLVGVSLPSDGYFLVGESLSRIHMKAYPQSLLEAFSKAIQAIIIAIQQPIRYAGPDQYGVFAPPRQWKHIRAARQSIACLPETQPTDLCVVIDSELWAGFCELSLWIEALCIHEWCLFTENLSGVERGVIYSLLTNRLDNRRPLTWEHNQIEILMMEGRDFICPWTGKRLSPANYDLDHLLPLSVYPINEIWNLVPSDSRYNRYTKRDRLPGSERLYEAAPRLQNTYQNYMLSKGLSEALVQDSMLRFGQQAAGSELPRILTRSIVNYLEMMSNSRNLALF